MIGLGQVYKIVSLSQHRRCERKKPAARAVGPTDKARKPRQGRYIPCQISGFLSPRTGLAASGNPPTARAVGYFLALLRS